MPIGTGCGAAQRQGCATLNFVALNMNIPFWLAASVAVTLFGLAKGGLSGISVMSIPLLSLVISPLQAAAIMLPILVVQDMVSVWAYRGLFDKGNLIIMLPGSVLGIFLGWLLAARVPASMVELAVGLVAILFVLKWFWAGKADRQPGPVSTTGGVFWGAVAGFTSFISHAGAPTFQVHVMPQRLPPQIYVGTSALFFAATNAIKILPYFLLGQFSGENLFLSSVLLPLAILATLAGVWLVRTMPVERFYPIVYTLTFFVGLKLIWSGGLAMLHS